jgi:hypothetical protein
MTQHDSLEGLNPRLHRCVLRREQFNSKFVSSRYCTNQRMQLRGCTILRTNTLMNNIQCTEEQQAKYTAVPVPKPHIMKIYNNVELKFDVQLTSV